MRRGIERRLRLFQILLILDICGERLVVVTSRVRVEACEEAGPVEGFDRVHHWQRRSALVLPRCQLDDALRPEWHGAAGVCAHVRPSVCGRSAVPTKAAIERHERPGGRLAAPGSGACSASYILVLRR